MEAFRACFDAGVLIPLNEEKRPRSFYSRSNPNDVARTEEFARRVATLQPRIDDLSARLEVTGQAQNRYLASIAIKEPETQKQRLAAYSLQARFALASIYDKAATTASGDSDAKDGDQAAGSGTDVGGAP